MKAPETPRSVQGSAPSSPPANLGSPEPLRLFVAIQIPDAIKAELEQAQAKLRRGLPEQAVRWTRPDQFHLTLKFLGKVEAHRVEALMAAARSACKDFAPLQMRAAKAGSFPGWHRPRVIWVGIEDAAHQLVPLQRALERASREFTAEEPENRFAGHVTLGRVKNMTRQQSAILAQAAAGLAEQVFGSWTANQIELMRSELGPSGAKHTALAAMPLKAS